jgi:hypothetical protein
MCRSPSRLASHLEDQLQKARARIVLRKEAEVAHQVASVGDVGERVEAALHVRFWIADAPSTLP